MGNIQPDAQIRAAVIGYGLAGEVFHAPLIDSTPGMTVSAIVTSDADRRARAERDYPQARVYTSTDELWRDAADYDLVIVAATNRAHVSLGIQAMQVGLPVVVDKPVAGSVAEAERLLRVSRETGRLFTVFQNRRWDNDFLTVRKIVSAGMLGSLTQFESRFERYRPTPKEGAWRESAAPEEAGGLLYDLGSHLIDQAMVLFGEPTHVYAEVDIRRPGAAVDDDTFVALRFTNGVRAHLWMSVVARVGAPRMLVRGLHGTFTKYGLDPQEEDLSNGLRPGDEGWGLESRERWGHLSTDVDGLHFDGPVESLPGSYEQFYSGVRDALRTGSPAPVDPTDSIRALRVIEAAFESAKQEAVVKL